MRLSNTAPAFKFQPFSIKQKKLITWWLPPSPFADYDMIICDGSVRSGKTIAMICGFIDWSLATFEHQTFILAGKTVETFKRNVVKPMLSILAARGIPYRHQRAEHCIQIGSNSYYYFGAGNEASQDIIQGLTAAGALLDEMALMPQSFIEQVMARCSVEDSKIWGNCNPEGPYHYVKAELIDKAEEKRILHLHFRMEDNLTLSPKRRAFYERMYTGLWYRRYVLGEWVQAEGVIYDMFNDKVHVIDREQLSDKFDEYFLGCDYGTGNPTVYLLCGRYQNKLYILKEYYWDSRVTGCQKTDVEYSADFKQFISGISYSGIAIDPSAASFIEQMKRDGARVWRAENEVLDGIRRVSTLLQQERLFIVGKECPNLVKEITGYVWDPKAAKQGEDKPLKIADHSCDALRYLVSTFFAESKGRLGLLRGS